MKEGFPFVLLIILFAFSVTIKANGITTDTLQPRKAAPQLKEKSITTETLIASGKMAGSRRLKGQQLTALSLKTMDGGFAPELQYHLVDTLYQGGGHYILLLGQWYDFENKAWIASYAWPHKLVDFKQVFYDNAEGFLSMETIIKANVLTITTLNDFEEGAAKKKVEKYRFTPGFKLQKL